MIRETDILEITCDCILGIHVFTNGKDTNTHMDYHIIIAYYASITIPGISAFCFHRSLTTLAARRVFAATDSLGGARGGRA